MKNTKNTVKTKTEWYVVIGNTIYHRDGDVTETGARIFVAGANNRKFVGRGANRTPVAFVNGVTLIHAGLTEGACAGYDANNIERVEIVKTTGRKRTVTVIENKNFVKKNNTKPTFNGPRNDSRWANLY